MKKQCSSPLRVYPIENRDIKWFRFLKGVPTDLKFNLYEEFPLSESDRYILEKAYLEKLKFCEQNCEYFHFTVFLHCLSDAFSEL